MGGRLVRKGRGSTHAKLQQEPLRNGGYATPALVSLEVSGTEQQHAELLLTTGEARVLAAQLLRLADIADLRLS